MTFQEQVEKYIQSLLTGDLVAADMETANIGDVVEAWVLLKYTADRIEGRLKDLRTVLLDRAEEFGKTTEKGGNKLSVDGTLVLREKRVAALPEEKGLKTLLAKHGIKNDQAFSKVSKVVLDASKVQALADLGKVPEEDIQALRKVTWALRVKESYDLADILESIVGEAGEELTEKAPKSKRPKASGNRKEG